MKFGPAEIGETVDTIAARVRWRGRLVAYRSGWGFIAVDGCDYLVTVPADAIASVR